MGKKKSNKSGEKEQDKARAFTLKVAMHCHCNGCVNKIRAAVKDITTHQGIDKWDQSALESKGELRLVATADPEKLRHRLHKATNKTVDLVFPKDNNNAKGGGKAAAPADAATTDARLLHAFLQQQQQQQGQYGQTAWAAANNPLLPLPGYGAAAPSSYPWAVQVQQPDPYAAAAGGGGGYPYAAWGAYAYPPPPQGHGHGLY